MTSAPGRRVAPVVIWVALAAVLGTVLAVSVSGGAAPSASERAAALEADLKCPSCDSISVLDSSAATAAAVRQAVLTRVRAGQSGQEIDAYLVSRYGPSILLRPPTTGLTALVWVVPIVAAVSGLGGLGVFFWRRRRPVAVAVTPQDRALVDRALGQEAAGDGIPDGAVPDVAGWR